MVIKICKECGIGKELSEFRSKVRNGKVYYENICKRCSYDRQNEKRRSEHFKKLQREKYAVNKEEINAKRRAKYVVHPREKTVTDEERLAKIKEWNKNNPDKRKEYVRRYHESHIMEEREYRKLNADKINKRVTKYNSKNRKRINAYYRERRKNPIIRLRHGVSCLVRFYIKGVKSGSVLDFLPYSIEDLRKHLENQFEDWMTWDNWGKYNSKTWDDNNQSTWIWQIDHIIPQSSLPYFSMQDDNFKKCWSLDNLRPLSAKENIIDGANRRRL